MIIYKITNLINGKIYIGKDTKNNPDYLGSGVLLKKAILKYGKNNFRKEIIEEISTIHELNEREIYWIDKLKACDKNIGYNIAKGGTGGDTYSENPDYNNIIEKLKNRKHTDDTKKKISENNWQKKGLGANTGKKWSDEHRSKMEKIVLEKGGFFKGMKHSEESNKMNREKHIGKKASQETKNKMSESAKKVIRKEHICPHCNKKGKGNAMKQWHFDNCKTRKQN